MTDNSLLPFSLPSVERKKITAAFDGGRISSDGGVMLLALADRRIGIADRLAAKITDRRDPTRVVHALSDILRARILAIACGYEDADDLDRLRSDPALKLACGRLPDSGHDLCSQPTVSRWENAPSLREVIRLMRAMVAVYCRSYDKPPASVTLDIDDTLDVVHGQQQLSMFNAHSDRTSCRSALANQVRLVLHTAAYWLMLTVRDAIPKPQPLALAEFATLRARLFKIAARITETASRVRVAFAAACPEADLFRSIARSLQPAGP